MSDPAKPGSNPQPLAPPAAPPVTFDALSQAPQLQQLLQNVSPTGKPLVPVAWVPRVALATAACIGVGSLAGGLAVYLPATAPVAAPVAGIAGVLGSIGLLLLGMSPGVRK